MKLNSLNEQKHLYLHLRPTGFFYLKSTVYNSTIIYFTDLFILYFFIQNAYANKKVFKKKG